MLFQDFVKYYSCENLNMYGIWVQVSFRYKEILV